MEEVTMTMPLYEMMMDDCVLLEKRRVLDGIGGWTTVWSEGEPFKAAIHKDSTIEARAAEKQGLTEVYTISVSRKKPLNYMDVFRGSKTVRHSV
jgi:hypothetical protein